MLFAGLQIDAEVLRGVGVVHVDRDVEGDAAHEVDQLPEDAEVDDDIAVRREADDLGHAQQQLLHPLLPSRRRS